jgi:hypothetical protein
VGTNHCLPAAASARRDVGRGTNLGEENCSVELIFESVKKVVYPNKLIFQGFPDDLQASYFHLAAQFWLDPEEYELYKHHDENLASDEILEKYASNCPDDGKKLATGNFVIFSKGSLYNMDESTYDAYHNRLSPSAFRQLIESKYISTNRMNFDSA